jgi:hypothetical protein
MPSSDLSTPASQYSWRLAKPHPQAKLQPLDMAAMQELFEGVTGLPDLDAGDRPSSPQSSKA